MPEDSAQLGDGREWSDGPTTDRRCKDVMLKAERGDTIEVEGHGQFEVARVTVTYFGPSLSLSPVDGGIPRRLTAPGPASQLMLWEPANVTDDGFHNGWKQVEEVRAFIAELGEWEFCTDCNSRIHTIEHARAAAFGVCNGNFESEPKDRDPRDLYTDGGSDGSGDGVPRVLDLFSGRGGVGLALDGLGFEQVGVDVEDYSDAYPGEFLQADASQFVGGSFDLVWASPPCTAYSTLSATAYGSAEAAREACPTIPELRVREIAEAAGAEYVIENVPGASRAGHLRGATRVNGLAFGKPYDLERHFETSFPVPDAYEDGEPSIGVRTREENDQSVADLAEAKGVPSEWGKQGVRSAIPGEFVRWVLSFCPTVDVERPGRDQAMLTEVSTVAE